MDGLDNVIWVLPILAVFDIASTLYVDSLGYHLIQYEGGFFARFFVHAGLTYVYAVIYLLMMVGFAYALWYIKNRLLSPSILYDKVFFVILVGATCCMYTTLTATFIGNLFLPYTFYRGNMLSLNAIVYLGTILGLAFYLWSDIADWLTTQGELIE